MNEYYNAHVLTELAAITTSQMKAICTRLDINLHHQDGQLLIDRDGIQRLRDAAEKTGFPDLTVVLQLALDAGGRRQP